MLKPVLAGAGVLGSLGAGLWGATQWAAYLLKQAPQLGTPWCRLAGWPLYPPWAYVVWYVHYATTPWGSVLAQAAPALCLGMGGALLMTWVARRAQRRRQATSTAFGSARWATSVEVRRAGLLAGEGVMLGTWQGRYLRHHGAQHIMVIAPTRAGKTAGIAVPTLLTAGGSTVSIDIKSELWEHTAGWRARFSHVVRFDPTHPASARFNPLLEIRPGDNEVRDAQGVADMLVDPEGSSDKLDHWQLTSHGLLTGVILHVLYAEPDKTLAGVAAFLSDPSRPFLDTLQVMLRTRHLPQGPHPVVASAAREVLNKSPNELSGVLSTAMSFLGLYRDPLVARATSTSDFCLAQLRSSAAPMSLYLVVPPSDLSRIRPLLRLLLNQLGRRLTEEHQASRPHQVLLVMDEFPALGHLAFFEAELAYLAGYAIRCILIAQSLHQLEKAYGPHHSLLDNCHIRVAMAANDDQTARRISDLLGQGTQQRDQASLSGKRAALWFDHRSVSRQEAARPLLTPGEVMGLPPHDELVLVAGAPPLRAQKVQYFADATLRARVLPPPVTTRVDVPTRPQSPWEHEGPKPLDTEGAVWSTP